MWSQLLGFKMGCHCHYMHCIVGLHSRVGTATICRLMCTAATAALTYAPNISPPTLESHQLLLIICWIIRQSLYTRLFSSWWKSNMLALRGSREGSRGQTGVCKSSSLRPPFPLHTNLLYCPLQSRIYVILANAYNYGWGYLCTKPLE